MSTLSIVKLGSHGHDIDAASVINWQSPHYRALSYPYRRVLLVYRGVKLTHVRVYFILAMNPWSSKMFTSL